MEAVSEVEAAVVEADLVGDVEDLEEDEVDFLGVGVEALVEGVALGERVVAKKEVAAPISQPVDW